MSTASTALTTWEEFLALPDEENGYKYELRDGEVVAVPPATPIHIVIQRFLAEWLTNSAQGRGQAFTEFPYRPALNLQFWYADVAYLPMRDIEAMLDSYYRVYAPPLIIEVLSPSNRKSKTSRQRIAAFSAGTREFWVIDPARKTVEVFSPGHPSHLYGAGEMVPISVLTAVSLQASKLFDRKSLTSPPC